MEESRKFPPMRRSRQQLSDEEAVKILRLATSGVLSLNGADGYPYGVPVSYVYDGGRLYFHSAISGHKIDSIHHSDKASFTVISKDDVHPETFTTFFRSVICFGKVRIVDDKAEKVAALRKLGQRYNPKNLGHGLDAEIESGEARTAVIEFTIEHVTGKEAIEFVKQKVIASK